MVDTTTPQSASLRRLVPRIFSRAQPAGAVDTLIRTVRMHHPKADLSLIERAYAVAERAHDGQKRRSGEPYITHPVAVAQILADLGIGAKTIAAALLHDTVEDTELHARRAAGRVRRRDRDARRRRHQARQGQVRRQRAGRDGPQDDRRDVERHPRAHHQARRPAAQRAHLGLRSRRERDAEGDGDARDLRAARAPPRYPDDQVGARGPLVRGALPEAVRRDREPGAAAHPGARASRAAGHRRDQRRPEDARRSAARSSVDPSSTTRSIRRWSCADASSTRSTTWSASGCS